MNKKINTTMTVMVIMLALFAINIPFPIAEQAEARSGGLSYSSPLLQDVPDPVGDGNFSFEPPANKTFELPPP